MTLGFHPYANLFPLIEGKDFYDLAEDIRVNGLHDRIDLIDVDGTLQILDGRNRYRALVWLVSTGDVLGAGWKDMADEPLTADYLADYENLWIYEIGDEAIEGDPLAYVLSKNLKRRHLDESQRAMVAARLPRVRHGGDRGKPSIEGLSSERRAELLNVGRASVERADLVQNHAARELVEAVDRGAIAVSAAAELAALPAERLQNLPRDQVTGKLTPEVKKALAPVIKEIRAEKQGEKKERRATREQALGRKLQAEPVKHYGVVLEDFEWDHEPWSRETGMDRHPSNHYPTAADAHTPEEIVARTADRFACAADDCVLYAWTTIPHEAIAHRVLELRGFKYVTQRAWIKTRPGNGRGPGYWVTGEHEILLVAVRGNVVPPATAHFRSCFEAPVGEHSEKPDQQYEHAEFHFPNLPKIELNARRARPGWKPWGFEAPPSHHEISEPADGFDPAHGATGGVLTPAMVAEQAGEPEAGETMTAGAGAASSPTLLAPADPAAVEGGRGHAPETNSSDHHDLDIPEFLRRPLKQTELDLTRRDRAAPEVVDGALQTRLPLTSDEIEMQSALRAIDAGHDVDWSIMRHLVGAGFVHATTTRLSVTDEGRAFLAQLVGLPTKAHAVAVRA